MNRASVRKRGEEGERDERNSPSSVSDSIAPRFTLLRRLGCGATSTVYLARDAERGGSTVALKVLTSKFLKSPVLRRRFENELQCARQLDHPNVVQVYDVFAEPAFYAYSMEYVAGGTLADFLPSKRTSYRAVVGILLDVAKALSAVHAAGILHRDLRPENILIGVDATAKLADFGIALQPRVSRLTHAGSMLGVLEWLSPEALVGHTSDERSDMYSLGVIAYRLAGGQVSGQDGILLDIIESKVEGTFCPLEGLPPDCPPVLRSVIHRATHRYPERRYQHAADLVADLQELQAHLERLYRYSGTSAGRSVSLGGFKSQFGTI